MMIALAVYSFVTLCAQVVLLRDRWRVRGTLHLQREDIASAVFGAFAWPVLAVVYVGVLVNVWTVRHFS